MPKAEIQRADKIKAGTGSRSGPFLISHLNCIRPVAWCQETAVVVLFGRHHQRFFSLRRREPAPPFLGAVARPVCRARAVSSASSASSRALAGRSARIFGETTHQEIFQFRRHRFAQSFGRFCRQMFHLMHQHFAQRGAVEQRLAGQQKIANGSDGINVRARVHLVGMLHGLRRHVERRAERGVGPGQSNCPSAARAFTRPKSSTFTKSGRPPRRVRKMFAGLMSR